MDRRYQVACIILGLAFLALPLFAHDRIKTVVGGGPNEIPGLATSIPYIGQIAADAEGNIYVFSGFGAVYKWSNGKVTHIAGDGTYNASAGTHSGDSFDGDSGIATKVQLNVLNAIAVDNAVPANVYISDSYYCIVQEIDQKTGMISPIAGNLATDSTSSGLSCIPFFNGVAVDGTSGGLYLAPNEQPVWFPPSLAPEGPVEDCSAYPTFSAPGFCLESLALDTSVNPANVYIGMNCRVDEIVGATGKIYTVAGSTTTCGFVDNVPATKGLFNQIQQIAVTGNGTTAIVKVADSYNGSIRQFTVSSQGGVPQPGTLTTIAGVAGAATCSFNSATALGACIVPTGIAIDRKGNTYFADADTGGVDQLLPSGKLAPVIGMGLGAQTLQDTIGQPGLSSPGGVFADPASANVFVGGGGNNAVYVWNSVTTRLSDVAGNGFSGLAGDGKLAIAPGTELSTPAGMAKDASGNLYIADLGNCRIREVNAASGIITTYAGRSPCGFSGDGGSAVHAQFSHPNAIAFDAQENLFVADTDNCAVRKIDRKTRVVTTIAGGPAVEQCSENAGFAGDGGPAVQAQLKFPTAVSLDGNGDIYIADSGNAAIREIVARTGIIQTVAGIGGNPGYNGDAGLNGSGLATQAELNTPKWVKADASGNLFIADSGNNIVRWVTPAGQIVTFGGTPPSLFDDAYFSQGFEGDGGPALNALLYDPIAIDQDQFGNFYVVDENNNRIRQISAFAGYGLSTASLTFASQTVGSASPTQTVQVSAIGPLKIGFVTVSQGFRETDTCTNSEFATGQTCEVQVSFDPKSAGPVTGTLKVYSSALLAADGYGIDNGNPDTVVLNGVASN